MDKYEQMLYMDTDCLVYIPFAQCLLNAIQHKGNRKISKILYTDTENVVYCFSPIKL